MFVAGLPVTTKRSACRPAVTSADLTVLEEVGAVGARHPDRFLGPQAGGDEQLHLPLIAESRDEASPARGIDAGQQAAAGGEERAFELHFLSQQPAPRRHAGRVRIGALGLLGAIDVLQAWARERRACGDRAARWR